MVDQLLILMSLILSLYGQQLEINFSSKIIEPIVPIAETDMPINETQLPHDNRSVHYWTTKYEWKEVEYLFPNIHVRDATLRNQSYIKGNAIPMDIAVDYTRKGQHRIFITTPRLNIGIPITLGTIARTVRPGSGGSRIRPYPNYSWHSHPEKCNGMTSVYRVAIDENRRIWILDTGKIKSTQYCPRQLLLFNLKTDRLLHRHVFDDSVFMEDSLFVNLVVDIRDSEGKDCFVYIADVTRYGIIVYDHSRDFSYRIQNKLFYPFPPSGTHRVAGEAFDLMDGVLAMALGPIVDQDRYLYFNSMASITENRVACSLLRDSTVFVGNSQAAPHELWVYKGFRESQSATSAIDSRGIMYFGLNEDTSIACWNTNNPYGKPFIYKLVRNETTLQFASSVKIVINTRNSDKEEVWILTNRLQKFFANSMNRDSVNFRIFTADVKTLTMGTICENLGESKAPIEMAAGNDFFEPVSIVPDQINYSS